MKVNSGGPFLKGRRIGVDKNRFKVRDRKKGRGGGKNQSVAWFLDSICIREEAL
jgi:hypothetical protein